MAILRSDHSALNQAIWPSPLCDQFPEIFFCPTKHLSIDDHWAKDGCHQLKGASVRGNWKFVHFAPKNHPKQVAPPMSYWVDLKKFSLASGLYLASPGPIKVGFAWRFHFAWPPIGWLTQSRSVKGLLWLFMCFSRFPSYLDHAENGSYLGEWALDLIWRRRLI